MIGKNDIIKIHLPGLITIDEVSVGVVQGVEHKASEVHSYEIEVHAFNT